MSMSVKEIAQQAQDQYENLMRGYDDNEDVVMAVIDEFENIENVFETFDEAKEFIVQNGQQFHWDIRPMRRE